jgi:hypothetical protein
MVSMFVDTTAMGCSNLIKRCWILFLLGLRVPEEPDFGKGMEAEESALYR